MSTDVLHRELFAFLKSTNEIVALSSGEVLTRVDAQTRLQELIPTQIDVRDVCSRPRAVVIAAPHVSFDHWSEYFCNRAAAHLKAGRVVAKHFRDQDNLHIPVSIGRHLHVNRPTESAGPGKSETETERARAAYDRYIAALRKAGGGPWPLNLLIEFHSHKQSPNIEVATRGFNAGTASELLCRWGEFRRANPGLPELLIEPIHKLRFSATVAKAKGSLQPAVCRHGLHIEIPRGVRRSEDLRQLANGQLLLFLESLLADLNL